MAQPPQSFTLDRSIFNESLYSHMRDFWFAGVPEGASAAPIEVSKRWWGGIPAEEKEQLDGQCRENFGHALDALKPDKLALPEFESYEREIENAEAIATPFLTEVKEAQAEDTKKGTDTLLSLILILDQMTRNTFRDPAGLRLVFRHFDRLAFTLLHAAMRLQPNPVEHEAYRLRPVMKNWFLLPLMHAEHIPSHDLFMNITLKWRKQVEEAGDEACVEYMNQGIKAEENHRTPLDKFGRYPHRNDALGRQSSEEEVEYMKTGQNFGVGQTGKKQEEIEKSEL